MITITVIKNIRMINMTVDDPVMYTHHQVYILIESFVDIIPKGACKLALICSRG